MEAKLRRARPTLKTRRVQAGECRMLNIKKRQRDAAPAMRLQSVRSVTGEACQTWNIHECRRRRRATSHRR